MKKVTAFFLAFMPFFVIILLFISGMIVKNQVHIYVYGVEINEQDQDVLKENSDEDVQVQLHAHVLPLNATNPDVVWSVSDENILTVDNDGLVTCKDYGEAFVYATSKENQTLSAACKFDVYDTVVHSVAVSNEYDASYVGLDSRTKLNVETKPSLSHVDNPTVTYTALDPTGADASEVIDVSQDGTIIPKGTGKAQVKIEAIGREQEGTKKPVKPVKTVDIIVGAGVDTIALKNPNKEIISSPRYNLAENLVWAPASSTEVSATDFTYECDSQLATINERGEISFLLPGTATFTASYRRNPSLKVTKVIECTCDYLKQVFFNQTQVNVVLDESGDLQTINDKLSWYVYPFNGTKEESKKTDGIEITSSDVDVIEVREGNGEPQLVVKGAGQATLTISIATSSDSYKLDTCLVNVTLPNNSTTKEVVTDTSYYALRNALPVSKRSEYKEDVTYSITDSEPADCAEIYNNEILVFNNKKSYNATATATVTATFASGNTRTIKVTSNAEVKELAAAETITIPAGQRTVINGWKPAISEETYADKFFVDETSSVFIPKCGQDIEKFPLTNEAGQTKTVHLIVTEQPLYIKASCDNRYYTSDYEVDTNETLACTIVPETATKKDGSHYSIDYSYYDPIQAETATIEDDVISFNKSGVVNVIANNDADSEQDTVYQHYSIHSTYGDKLGKFTIVDHELVPTKTYESYGDPIELAPGEYQHLFCRNVNYSLYDKITITSTTGLCQVQKEWRGLALTGHIRFTITAPDLADKKYGRDIICISSNEYAIYLYVDISAKVNDFIVTRSQTELNESGENKTYTPNLILKVTPTPCAATSPAVSATLNDTECTFPRAGENYIELPSNAFVEGENSLVIKCDDVEKTYKLNYYPTDKYTPNFWIDGTDETNKELYLAFNSIQKNCVIKTDGFVDESWYKDKLSFSFAEKRGDEQAVVTSCYLTISGIPSPVKDFEYTNKFTITCGSESKTYDMGRDIVSKIVLPKHDNTDMTDKKGLQKVHVYGNKSFYAEDMKEVDYYKLPVQVYDFNRKLITNTEEKPHAVADALKTLKIDTGKSNTTCKINDQGYIEVYFGKNDLYSFDDVSNNKFDAKQNKNVTVTVETKSNETKANYTFVAVDGVNQYCQEGLKAAQKDQLSTHRNVLQTNFGLEEGAKDNAKLDDTSINEFSFTYGNGYTLNLNELYKKLTYEHGTTIGISGLSNGVYQGCNDGTLQNDVDMFLYHDPRDKDSNTMYSYSIVKNVSKGIDCDTAPVGYSNIFKNCLFTGPGTRVFDGTDEKTSSYLENCVIFNSCNFPIIAKHKSKFYFKGIMDCYNFHGKEMLKDFDGQDVSILWPTVLPIIRANDGVQIGADGRDYMNTFMITAMAYDCIFFYNPETKQYENSNKGFSGNCDHITKIFDFRERVFKIEAGFWGTKIPSVDIGAPSYYDEFDGDGNIRADFLYNQIKKLSRVPTYF